MDTKKEFSPLSTTGISNPKYHQYELAKYIEYFTIWDAQKKS